ncbi:radical SAM protein [Chloroflexota bacterium]
MTTTAVIPVKRRQITSGTKEWADHNVNCVKGCSNDCRYCYARMMAKRFGRCQEHTWKNMIINKSAVDRDYVKYKGRVMFPSTHDITDDPGIQEACFTVIRRLLQAGNEVLVTTKPRLAVIEEIIERSYAFRAQLQFRFTITSADRQLLSFWEPNAPKFEERFASLQYAYEQTFKTSVSIEPFLDHTPQTLVHSLSPYVTESIWLGPMNYIPSNGIPESDRHCYENIRYNYLLEHLQELYEDLRDNPIIRFKDSMIHRLGPVNHI